MKRANPLLMDVLANQAKVMTGSRRSSNRMTISLPGIWPTRISGERSIEKINMASPASVFTSVTIKTRTPKIIAMASVEESPVMVWPMKMPTIRMTKTIMIVMNLGSCQFIGIVILYSKRKSVKQIIELVMYGSYLIGNKHSCFNSLKFPWIKRG